MEKPLVFDVPVLGFAAYSGTGKTSLLVKLIPVLKQHGLRLAMIKHAHHDFDIDKPGKDSFELRKAGADQMLIASDKRIAFIEETNQEPDLTELVNRLDLKKVDLILVEGFRHVPFAKIELHRPALQKDLIFPNDSNVIAVAADEKIETGALPLLNLNQIDKIAGFINRWMYPEANRRSCS